MICAQANCVGERFDFQKYTIKTKSYCAMNVLHFAISCFVMCSSCDGIWHRNPVGTDRSRRSNCFHAFRDVAVEGTGIQRSVGSVWLHCLLAG